MIYFFLRGEDNITRVTRFSAQKKYILTFFKFYFLKRYILTYIYYIMLNRRLLVEKTMSN